MRFSSFLKDKVFYFLILGIVCAFVLPFAHAFGIGIKGGIFLDLCFILAYVVPLGLEYLQRKKFYDEIQSNIEGMDKKFLIGEMLEEPLFTEGKVLYDCVSKAGKSMNDEISRFRRETKEYREYVEMWIHEVKTPIASSRLLLENKNYGELEKELDQIDAYAEQALYYARSTNPEKDYVIKKVKAVKLVQDAVKKISRQFIRNRVKMELEESDAVIYTDVKWTGFILGQILGNAIKYRSADPVIRIMIEEDGENVKIVIQDNGIGIPAADLPRVFEKGFTGTAGRNYEKSTGIGLYLCKNLCGKLQIPIHIRSEEGKGTELTLHFLKNNYIEMN